MCTRPVRRLCRRKPRRHRHRLKEAQVRRRGRRNPTLGARAARDARSEVHQRHDPSARDAASRIGILPAWPRCGAPVGCLVAFVMPQPPARIARIAGGSDMNEQSGVSEAVLLRCDIDGIAWLTLNRPAQRNALSMELMEALVT